MNRWCNSCGRMKPVSEFSIVNAHGNLDGYCLRCRADKINARRERQNAAEKGRVSCPKCHRAVLICADGNIRRHKPVARACSAICEGSGVAP